MAQLENEEVFIIPVMGIMQFIEKFHTGMTPAAVRYAMDNDKVDYTRIGHERLIVLTEKTKAYVPNYSFTRLRKKLKKIQEDHLK